MTPFLRFSWLTAWGVLLASRAQAAEPREVLVAKRGAPCVDAEALGKAIHRDTTLPVRVIAGDPPASRPNQVVVAAEGKDKDLVVTLRGVGLDVTQQVRAPSCETATDVVAAFAVSALAPAPAMDIPAAPSPEQLTTERVRQIVGDGLASRDVQLTEHRVRMTVEASGERYTLRFVARGARCERSQSIELGADLKPESLKWEAANVVAPRVAAMVNQRNHCLETDVVERKGALLAEEMKPGVEQAEMRRRASPVILPLEGAVTTMWLLVAAGDSEPTFYLFGAGYAFVGAGTAVSLIHGNSSSAIAESVLFAGAGLFTLGTGFGRANGRFSPYAAGALSGAFFVESALSLTGALSRRGVSNETLASDYHRVASAEQRNELTEADIARIEDDFRRSSSPVPRWLLAGPWFAGGSTALVAAFADTQTSTLPRVLEGILGATMVAGGLLAAFPQTGYGHYERVLAQKGLQASFMPLPSGGGLVLRGKF